MKKKLLQTSILAVTFALIGAVSSVYANPATLAAGQTIPLVTFATDPYAVPTWVSGGAPIAPLVTDYGSDLVVASGVAAGSAGINPGGLTFYYEAANYTAASAGVGITAFVISGFANLAVSIDVFNFAPYIAPDWVARSADGNDITFAFLPVSSGPPGPPIFAGQISQVFALYTDATDFTIAADQVGVTLFDSGAPISSEVLEASTAFAPSVPVPETGATAMLLGLGMLTLAARNLRRKH